MVKSRQGMIVTIRELRELADDLESQARRNNIELDLKDERFIDEKTKFQINIINKEGLSDTWEIEDTQNEPKTKKEEKDPIYKYKCGHKSHGMLVLDDNELSALGYFDWAETVGVNGDMSKCWDCYCKDSQNHDKAKVCGNSNMRDLTEEDRRNGRSHRCSIEDPCKQCISSNADTTSPEVKDA